MANINLGWRLGSLLLAAPFILYPVTKIHVGRVFDGIWDSILRAVPKQKVSRTRARQRRYSHSKHHKNKLKSNIESCYGCGEPKLRHHICSTCASKLIGK
eukprot:TRINITY_DN2164_c0_g1_i3.p1 TRINITY_DN2164_c0_g1~~TRINITY_DN2164_c0_g1_i3.p1  ORF type:complete len:113 (-),score=8.89 TRINITY_DN2164_c0_g1_i3:87-386(-)